MSADSPRSRAVKWHRSELGCSGPLALHGPGPSELGHLGAPGTEGISLGLGGSSRHAQLVLLGTNPRTRGRGVSAVPRLGAQAGGTVGGVGRAQGCSRPNGLLSWPAASAAATCTSPSSTTPRSAWRSTPCSSSTPPPGSCCSPLSPSSSSSPSRPSSSSLSGRVGGHVPGALKPSPTPSCSPGQPVALSAGETARTPQQMGPDVGRQDAQRGAGALRPPAPGRSWPPLLRGQ